ncbi:MAG: hypothetical protein JXA78_06715 [Anaerolineales bacterium]|nr:hypothetical protein [Anaerolineales bacterium]
MNNNMINTESERQKVLRMVEAGKIKATEGISLLQALEQEPGSRRAGSQPPTGGARWFHVRVTDLATGKNRASVSIPMGVMEWGLRIGAQFAPEIADVDLQDLQEALCSGMEGKIIDVVDDEDSEHVEIFIE